MWIYRTERYRKPPNKHGARSFIIAGLGAEYPIVLFNSPPRVDVGGVVQIVLYNQVQRGVCIGRGSPLGNTSSSQFYLIPRWTQTTTRPRCKQDAVACYLPLNLKYSCTTDKEGQKIVCVREIFGKNIKHHWGAYVHVAIYYTLD